MARVLVIDDAAPVLEMLQHVLERHGHDVAVATDGEEGLALLHENPADLVITDIFMPGKEGIEIIVELRKQSLQTKIIAISGGGQSGNVDVLVTAKDFGADYILAKPFERQDLLDAVNTVLG